MSDAPTSSEDRTARFSEEELRARLTPMQYRVTQEQGTEPPFQNEYHETDRPGDYRCIVCDEVLFTAQDKFHSACGWPAFNAAAQPDGKPDGRVEEHEDRSHGMVRTEVRCRRCGAHLGHVFPDGPPPTGLRYCINSAAIRLVPPDPS